MGLFEGCDVVDGYESKWLTGKSLHLLVKVLIQLLTLSSFGGVISVGM